MAQRKLVGALLILAASACTVATPNKKVGAGIAAGMAVTGAAIYRGTTGGCWAQCTHGRICDRASGTCVEAARGPAGSVRATGAATSTASDTKWWDSESPCPAGASLQGSTEERVIRCVASDGTPDGPMTLFHGNGRKELEGWNCSGVPCRVWTAWDEDGQVLKTEDRGTPSPAAASPAAQE